MPSLRERLRGIITPQEVKEPERRGFRSKRSMTLNPRLSRKKCLYPLKRGLSKKEHLS